MNQGRGFRSLKRRRQDHGVDDWLMTYADMITLLLCFFAVFLSVSVPREDQMEVAREKVLEHFAAPDRVRGDAAPRPDVTGSPREDVPFDALPSIIDNYHSGEGRSFGDGFDAGADQGEALQSFGGRAQADKDAAAAQNDQRQPDQRQTDDPLEGDRITIIEMPAAAFFASGSALLSADGQALLRKVYEENLRRAIAEGFQITVEGHTDNIPINTVQFPSNWELSTARAAAVVKYLLELGAAPQHMRAAGYADVLPKVANDTPDNRAQNRRVVLKMERLEQRAPE